ncbi:MAG: hypothetical protein LM577_00635 [Thermoproteaceae archaeon]|nr:hypothetical protein [Thermoproteaceae archaeon]
MSAARTELYGRLGVLMAAGSRAITPDLYEALSNKVRPVIIDKIDEESIRHSPPGEGGKPLFEEYKQRVEKRITPCPSSGWRVMPPVRTRS